jgi:isoleucyl-tRNA synthetase
VPEAWLNPALGARWAGLRDLRRVATGALELERGAKRIGSSLQAAIELYVPAETAALLDGVDLAELCITSAAQVSVDSVPADAFTLPDVPGVAVVVTGAPGDKCERCWRVLPEVGDVTTHSDLCHRCADVVGHMPAAAQ